MPGLGLPVPVGLAAPVRAKAPISTVPTPRRLPVDTSDLQDDHSTNQLQEEHSTQVQRHLGYQQFALEDRKFRSENQMSRAMQFIGKLQKIWA